MRQSIAAAAAAISAIFLASADAGARVVSPGPVASDASAQQNNAPPGRVMPQLRAARPVLPCSEPEALAENLAEYDEKLIALGQFEGIGGLFAAKFKAQYRQSLMSSLGRALQNGNIDLGQYVTALQERLNAFDPSEVSGYFQIYGNKDTGSWTAVATLEEGAVSCVLMTGDDLEIQSPYSRAPGLPVSMAPEQTPLEKLEYELTWGKNGGHGLQLKAGSNEGELRIYANTHTGHFIVIRHNPQTGQIEPLTGGEMFPSLDSVEATRTRLEARSVAEPAPPAPVAPAPEVIPQ